MNNFNFYCPTKIVFGKGTELEVGKEVKNYSNKVLLHYGKNSIRKSGLYDKVVKCLKEADIEFIELSGVKPNPSVILVREGIKICRENNINFILAVGGGSVIDSAKGIAMGVPYDGDVWDFFANKTELKETLPVGTILTLPGTGTESSFGTVLTNEDGMLKLPFNNILLRPVFSILNPELTYTLPKYQSSSGIADMMTHIMERYFTHTKNVDLIDKMSEGALKSIIKNGKEVIKNPTDYNSRAEIMWAGTLAHNDLLGTGRVPDWASHIIEHELSAYYDVAHGAGLSVIYPNWMKYVYKENIQRFAQFAVRVFNVEYDFEDPKKTVIEGIDRLTNLFKELGLPTTLKELNIPDEKLELMAEKCTASDTKTLGSIKKLNKNDVLEIFKLSR